MATLPLFGPDPEEQRDVSFDRVTFNERVAQIAKVKGMSIATAHRHELLELCREALRRIASNRPNRIANADDAMRWLISIKENPSTLGPAAGSLFSKEDWEFVTWVKSKRVSNHARFIRCWRLK
jgi:hypothetical protein